MLRSRRIALAAAAIVLGLSACGDAGSTTTAGKAPAVIHLGAANAGGKIAAPTAGGAATDSMMRPFGTINYVFDGTYPDLGTSGPAYQLPIGAAVDSATVAKLAALLGVEGTPRAMPADQGGGWMVGPADYSGATLTVAADGMSSWWYSPAPTANTSTGGCVVDGKPMPDIIVNATAGDTTGGSASSGAGTDAILPPDTAVAPPDGGVDPSVAPCDVAPPPPSNVPTQAQATEKTSKFLGDLGLDATKYQFTAYADAYGASATAWLVLDGHRTPLQVNVGYGAEGALTWASGSLATAQVAGDYPIVSPQDALARLNDPSGKWSYFGGPVAMKGGGVGIAGVANDAATSVAVAGGAGVVSTGSGSAPAVAPAPPDAVAGDPGAAPEPMPVCDPAADCVIEAPPADPITVTLHDVRLDLTMVWDADGTVWLLPAYTFTTTDGGEYTVVAVDDSLLDVPTTTPVDTTPVPVDTAVVSPPDTAVVSPPDTAVVSPPADTVVPDTTILPVDAPTTDAAAPLVGKTLDEATAIAATYGWTIRVSTLDGEGQALTDDYGTNRVNVSVAAGVVTAIDFIG